MPERAAGDEFDPARPSVARVYDYYLGGSLNFAVDREMAAQAIALWPDLPLIMAANRAFLRRAVLHCVRAGITQFLDLGSGIPTVGNVHEVAQQANPEARVVYVDYDPIAVTYSRSILSDNPRADVVQADFRESDHVLRSPGVTSLLDLTRPVAVMMVAVLHFVTDQENPAALIAAYRNAIAPGSFLVISHATFEGQPNQARPHEELYRRTSTPLTMRSRETVTGWFDGFDLVAPGVVYLPQWRPLSDEDVEDHPERFSGWAAVGQKR